MVNNIISDTTRVTSNLAINSFDTGPACSAVSNNLMAEIESTVKAITLEKTPSVKSNDETAIYAVIGANYGDEGKGSVTHWIASRYKSRPVLNILYNGGMQRGHTVHYGDKNHVFHCFGSGTFMGAKTYWAAPFLVDPEAAKIEFDILNEPSIDIIFAHPRCRIVTPWDIAMNRFKERIRGDLKHGSCGMGIFETIERNKKVSLYLNDCKDVFTLYQRLREIEKYYEKKFIEMGMPEDFAIVKQTVSIDGFMKGINWLRDIVVEMSNPWTIQWDAVIFEGGQGLALSQTNTNDFPHLTPSYTGSEEIIKICDNRKINVFYVTRPYFTRHGAGPLPKENMVIKKYVMKDETNEPNEYQGSIRYGLFDADAIKNRIEKDLNLYKNNRPWVTMCMSQSSDGNALVKIEDAGPVYKSIIRKFVGTVDELCVSEVCEDNNIAISYIS